MVDTVNEITKLMHLHNTPGASIAVVEQGRIDWANGFGVTTQGGPLVTEATLFQAASISKPVFALAVMLLAHQGALDIDEDVNTYLESWKLEAKISLRQLLSHSSGTTVHGFPGYPRDEELPSLVQILEGEAPANTGKVRVDTVPGLQFRYSGGGTTLAQLAVQDITGKDLPELMQQYVFTPLGMENSTYLQPLPKEWQARAAISHLDGKLTPGGWHVYPEQAAAGLWTTPTDLAKLGIALQQSLKGMGPFPQEIIQAMLTRQVDDYICIAQDIGIGFFLNGQGQEATFGHNGSNHGFMARFVMFRELGKGYVIMVNSGSAALLGEIEQILAATYAWPGYLIDQACTGSYLLGDKVIRITQENGELSIHFPQQVPLPLRPFYRNGNYIIDGLNTGILFQLVEGKVVGFYLNQNQRPMQAIKVDR